MVEENEQDRARAEAKTDEDSTSCQSNMREIPEYHPNFVLVIMHGLVSRVRRASYSIIGQSIDAKHDDDIETGCLCPETPPSPFRRVFSLESSTTQHRHRRTAMKRRPSFGDPSEAAPPDVTLPDVIDEQPTQPEASDLRRVVSDFTGITRRTTSAAATTIASLGTTSRVLPLSFRPRTISRMAQYDHSERSIEDEIVAKQVSSGGRLLSEDAPSDILLDHEIS